MSYTVYAIEGLDRLGKSTLIEGILNRKGYFEIIHFSKPKVLRLYQGTEQENDVPEKSLPVWHYQRESFRNSMLLAKSGARLIFDRWHLGEAVYAPLYRSYSGNYVFDMERAHGLDFASNVKLILLTENFKIANHFVDDGESFDPNKREKEQELFISAFERSILPKKQIICVTDERTGGFRQKEEILMEALQE